MAVKPIFKLFAIARVNFLTLTLACLLLALALSYTLLGGVNSEIVGWVVAAGLLAHVSVNAFNEYFDFHSGLDFKTRKTPFSGGSGTLVQHPHIANAALVLACASLLAVIASGLWIVNQTTTGLLWLGIPGVLLIYSYTQYINRYPILCLIAPGLGFGLFLTLGASWALASEYPALVANSAWYGIVSAAAIVMLLVNNLLLLNQFPDVEADVSVGRKHFPISIGRTSSTSIFAAQLLLSYLVLVIAVAANWLPFSALLALLSFALVPRLLRGVHEHANNIPQLIPFLGLNVAVIHLFILLLALGIWFNW